jgi:RIO-like serine/threonine protein kinase
MLVAESHSLGGAWLQKSFLATGQAAGNTLEKWVRQYEEDLTRLESMAEQMRGIFNKMAQYRITHGDLKATNILVARDDSVSFVDLDATQFLSPARDWSKRRQRDARIFAENWSPRSTAAKIFATVFPTS